MEQYQSESGGREQPLVASGALSGYKPLTPLLLQSKLYVPPLRPLVVPRPRLRKQLDGGLGKLTLISAPAGFGKTTLVTEWLWHNDEGRHSSAAHQGNVAWLSLDESDNDPIHFWRYVIAALQNVLLKGRDEAASGVTVQTALESPQLLSPEGVVTILINQLMTISHPFILVLDDYHLIRNNAVHQSLNFLITHQPPHMYLILLTRADPPLSLGRLRVQGQLLELRAADLRFTLEEMSDFLARTIALTLSSEDMALLEARTEGWAAGLQLAALSLKGLNPGEVSRFVHAFTGTHHHVLAYLIEEVLQRQPENVQSFLLQTSILHRLTAPLCQVVTQQDDGQAMLFYLEHNNLFTLPLDNKGRWYRYHALFAEMLRTRLHQTHPELIPELHRRASDWYRSNGNIDKGVHHALAAGDYATAVELIDHAAENLWTHGGTHMLLEWLNALPHPELLSQPRLCLLRVWLLFLHDQWAAAAEALQTAREVLRTWSGSDKTYLCGRLAAIEGAMAAHRHEPESTIKLAQEALDALHPDDISWRNVSAIDLGLAHLALGEAAQASATFLQAADLCSRRDNIYLAFAALWHLAEAYLAQGRLREAEGVYQRLAHLDEGRAGHRLALSACADVGLGGLAYERDELETARTQLSRGLRRLWPGGQPRVVLYGRIMLARCLQALGMPEAAREHWRQAEEVVRQFDLKAESGMLAAHLARFMLAQGEQAAVEQWLRVSGVSINDAPDYRHEVEHLMLTRLLLAEGRFQEAEALLARLLQPAETNNRDGSVIQMSILLACAQAAQGKASAAAASIGRALKLAEPQGYVRTFIDDGLPVAAVLHTTLVTVPAQAYARKLLAAFSSGVADVSQAAQVADAFQLHLSGQTLLDPLTVRELEILSLIASGASNKQIADHLVISVGTVKGHINHILSKLAVRNRTQAVARAREIGLLKL